MKQGFLKLAGITLVTAILAPSAAPAQTTVYGYHTDEKGKGGEQIVITTNDSVKKYVIEVDGENVLVNGKKVEDAQDITITRRKVRDWEALAAPGALSVPGAMAYPSFRAETNRALLGVTTERAKEGVSVLTISKNSAAEKAGLKKGDIITRINEEEIDSPDDLSKAIRAHKPGDKVTVTYTRETKTDKVTAELGKTRDVFAQGNGNINFHFDEENLNRSLAQLDRIPHSYTQVYGFGGSPRLGITVQDSEDGKGVDVLNVNDDGNAGKAGLKEDDVILEVDGKAVNSADELAKIMKDSKEKASVKFKYQRDGKTATVDVRVPKRLKTANL